MDNETDEIAEQLLALLGKAVGTDIPQPIATHAHRWRHALSAGTGDGALWNPGLGLGVCGDWLLGPRVECAWLSGQMLARRCTGTVAVSDAGTTFTPEPSHPIESLAPTFAVSNRGW